jgi:hypothetical protein
MLRHARYYLNRYSDTLQIKDIAIAQIFVAYEVLGKLKDQSKRMKLIKAIDEMDAELCLMSISI